MILDRVRLDELIATARARQATDLHLGGSEAPALRINGRLTALDIPPLASSVIDAYLEEHVERETLARLANGGTIDLARRSGTGAPYRLHAYRTQDGIRIAIRFLAATIVPLERLGLPGSIAALVTRPNGLVIFTGPTGSGKTTALAAVVDRINQSAERVILTVEDPVEYVHRSQRSLIAHCEVGRDISNFAYALRGFMRADPDVILVGEMRDRETMAAALTAAETGHLVLTTLHTNDAPQTVDRIVDAFPAESQAQIRTQLAATLVAVISMRLVPLRDGNGRTAACEVLVANDAVRALIRDAKTHQLRNVLSTGRAAGMQTLEMHLSDLVVRGTVTGDAARLLANRPAEVRDLERIGA